MKCAKSLHSFFFISYIDIMSGFYLNWDSFDLGQFTMIHSWGDHGWVHVPKGHNAIITWLWRQNDVATSFRRHTDVIIASCVRWGHSLNRKGHNFDEIFIICCTGRCQNSQCSQWWKLHQNEELSVSVFGRIRDEQLLVAKKTGVEARKNELRKYRNNYGDTWLRSLPHFCAFYIWV